MRGKKIALKTGLSSVWGMIYAYILITIGIILNLALLKAILELSRQITDESEELNHKLAEAISSVVQKFGFEGQEPPNQIQGAIAQLILNKVQQTQGIKEVVSRSGNGQFK